LAASQAKEAVRIPQGQLEKEHLADTTDGPLRFLLAVHLVPDTPRVGSIIGDDEPRIDEHAHERGRFLGFERETGIALRRRADETGDGVSSIETADKGMLAGAEAIEFPLQRIFE
jgi:hypothetical protein